MYTMSDLDVAEKAPKLKYIQKKADSDTSAKKKHVQATKGTRLKSKVKVAKPDKKKQPAKKTKAKGLAVLSKVALTEAEQIKLATKKSKKDFHVSHVSGSGDRVDTQSKVPDEQQQKTFDTDGGAGTIPGVPDVPPYESESDKESWGNSENEDDGDNDDDGESDDHDEDSDDERTKSDNDKIPDPNLTNVDQTKYEEKDVDDRVCTPSDYELTDDEKLNDEETIDEEEDDEIPSPPLPPLPLSLHLPSPVPTSFPLPSSPLPPLLVSLFIPPPIDRREDIPEAELPPCKRLCLTALTSRYKNIMPPKEILCTARAIVLLARAPMSYCLLRKLIEARCLRIEGWMRCTMVQKDGIGVPYQDLCCGEPRYSTRKSEEVKKYFEGLPDMIQGNVMSYQPKTMEKAIEFANDQMDQKVLTITKRQAEQKRKLEFNAGNNKGAPTTKQETKYWEGLHLAVVRALQEDCSKAEEWKLWGKQRGMKCTQPSTNGISTASTNLVLPVLINTASRKELVLLMVKAAELKIRMHGDYYGMVIFELGSRSSVLEPVHLRNFGSMRKWELENSQNNAIAKLPMLQTRRVRDVEIRIIAVLSEDLDYELWGGFKSLLVGVVTPPEDLNVKILRSLPSKWDTHVVVWMNKPDFDTMGLDDLYNNFKIVKQKVKKSTGAVNDEKNLAFLTTSGASIFSDATVFAFVVYSTTKGPQLVHEDFEQLHDDDLEEMDLKWNMALLSMRARKFYQRTGRKIIIDGTSTAGYDKSKIGVVIDWSDMAEKEIQANIGFHHSQIQSFNSGEDFDHHSDTAVPKPYGSEEHLNEDWP
ncbi:hypothetical protein Tco_0286788 [Tanacetum coccineum]